MAYNRASVGRKTRTDPTPRGQHVAIVPSALRMSEASNGATARDASDQSSFRQSPIASIRAGPVRSIVMLAGGNTTRLP